MEKRENSLFLDDIWCQKCENILGKDLLKKIAPYLKEAKAIAIDAPLTIGRGKGKMRLFEKFLSQKIFRKEKTSPLPPALMKNFCDFAAEIRKKLESRGFVLDINLIEVFPTLIKKAVPADFLPKVLKVNCPLCWGEDTKFSLLCAAMAYLHYSSKTRYLGYKDGFLFLPEMSFWQKDWQGKFRTAWQEKPYLHYRRLTTNLLTSTAL